jgi:alkaline phosphatase D
VQENPQPIWDSILAAQPDVFLSLGDIVYVNRGKEDAAARRKAYDLLAAIPAFRALRNSVPFLATWDDGEFGWNDGGWDFARKEEFRQDFLDFLGEPADSERRNSGGVYDAHIFGPEGRRVQIILLDTRSFRSKLRMRRQPDERGRYLPDDSAGKTMLGAKQWKWLEEQFRKPADVRLLASSIQLISEEHGWEKWANFPRERKMLFDLIRATRASGVIILSGDRHHGELSVMEGAADYPLYDLTSSALNATRRRPPSSEPNRHRLSLIGGTDNFGLIEIDWGRSDPLIAMQLRDAEGHILSQRRISLSQLQPRQPQ